MKYFTKKKEFDFDSNFFTMGILNITPDSFYDGGKNFKKETAFKNAIEMVNHGADILDIGGESSRPGSEMISAEEEMERVIPFIQMIKNEINIPISIDTYKSVVAKEAIENGAEIINDISGLSFDSEMVEVAAKYDVITIINHIKGKPKTMQEDPFYENVIEEIKSFFIDRIKLANGKNVNKIILDPGIGFGKNLEHNLRIFNNLNEFAALGFPILIGCSRKRFIGEILNNFVENRMMGTASAVAISIYNGANIIRVHDVKEMKEVATIAYKIKQIQ